jgi:uncharacterized protein YkwD
MPLRATAVRLLALCVIAGATLVAAPAPGATPAETKFGTKVMTSVNQVRATHDRVRLKRQKCLQGFADRQAARLAKAQPDPGDLGSFHANLHKVQDKCGLGWVGENLAFHPGKAKDVVQAWMNSPLHKSNILFRPFRLTGVAARKGGGYWWAVQMFGRKP